MTCWDGPAAHSCAALMAFALVMGRGIWRVFSCECPSAGEGPCAADACAGMLLPQTAQSEQSKLNCNRLIAAGRSRSHARQRARLWPAWRRGPDPVGCPVLCPPAAGAATSCGRGGRPAEQACAAVGQPASPRVSGPSLRPGLCRGGLCPQFVRVFPERRLLEPLRGRALACVSC